MRLLLTCQPSFRAAMAARRHPQRGRFFEKSRRNALSASSKSATTGGTESREVVGFEVTETIHQ